MNTDSLEVGGKLDYIGCSIVREGEYGFVYLVLDQNGNRVTGLPTLQRAKNAIKKLVNQFNDLPGWARDTILALEAKANNAQRLADALATAADWLSRSVRIDDQEQAQDAREALAQWEKDRQ